MHSIPEVPQPTVHYLALQGRPGIHIGVGPPSAITGAEHATKRAKTNNKRTDDFFTVLSFSRKTRFSSAVQKCFKFLGAC
jgi:hypothetical protein